MVELPPPVQVHMRMRVCMHVHVGGVMVELPPPVQVHMSDVACVCVADACIDRAAEVR